MTKKRRAEQPPSNVNLSPGDMFLFQQLNAMEQDLSSAISKLMWIMGGISAFGFVLTFMVGVVAVGVSLWSASHK